MTSCDELELRSSSMIEPDSIPNGALHCSKRARSDGVSDSARFESLETDRIQAGGAWRRPEERRVIEQSTWLSSRESE